MRILLIEDEDPKRRHIETFIRELMPTVDFRTARSFNSAVDALESELPDLVLLDMSLPTFEIGDQEKGGRPQGFGGTEILRHLKLSDLVCPIVVLTGYEAFPKGARQVDLAELEAELLGEFPDLFMGVIYFNSAYDEWKHKLSQLLERFASKEG